MAAGDAGFLCAGCGHGSVFGHFNDMGRAFHGADSILIAFFSINVKQVHDFSFFLSKIPDPAWEFNMPGQMTLLFP
jgi:hypothetical protein